MIKEETIGKIRKFVSDRNWKQFHTNCNLAKSIVLEASEILELFQWQEDAKNIETINLEDAKRFKTPELAHLEKNLYSNKYQKYDKMFLTTKTISVGGISYE